jgi:hypothetical protein
LFEAVFTKLGLRHLSEAMDELYGRGALREFAERITQDHTVSQLLGDPVRTYPSATDS